MKRGWHIPEIRKHNLKWRKGMGLLLLGFFYISLAGRALMGNDPGTQLLIVVSIAATALSYSDYCKIFSEYLFELEKECIRLWKHQKTNQMLADAAAEYNRKGTQFRRRGTIFFYVGVVSPALILFTPLLRQYIDEQTFTNIGNAATLAGLGFPILISGFKTWKKEKMQDLKNFYNKASLSPRTPRRAT